MFLNTQNKSLRRSPECMGFGISNASTCVTPSSAVKKDNTTGSVDDLPRGGRPPILSDHQNSVISRAVRDKPNMEYKDVAQVALFVDHDETPSKPLSRSTLYKLLQRCSLTNAAAKSVQSLTAHVRYDVSSCVASSATGGGTDTRSSSQTSALSRRVMATPKTKDDYRGVDSAAANPTGVDVSMVGWTWSTKTISAHHHGPRPQC
ncbi:hypothetical protein IQ06DRAFT_308072 [Phaeosphaeriaceae sp. SRC1lsM3a]|nr:hypothetical protein IQ06DRAFT_308072 [Stagonospora sp. SRC1lsM3a]